MQTTFFTPLSIRTYMGRALYHCYLLVINIYDTISIFMILS